MKTRAYIRIGKARMGTRFAISNKANFEPLYTGSGNYRTYVPTVSIALDIDIPDKEFDATKILLDAKIKTTTPCIEITQEGTGAVNVKSNKLSDPEINYKS